MRLRALPGQAFLTKAWGWIVLIGLVCTAVGLIQTVRGRAVLRMVGLSSPSGDYTALSFSNPQELPARLTSRVATIPISFVVRNASGSPTPQVYRWTISVSHAGRSQTAAAGQVQVPSGTRTLVNTTVRTRCVGGHLKLAVHLTEPAESIDLVAACWSPKGNTP